MDSPPFGPVRQIDAGLLDVGYVDTGPSSGQPVVLLHGWPYDIHSYADVAPALGAAGYRVVVPYLRGYGTTRFRSDDTVSNGQQAALASEWAHARLWPSEASRRHGLDRWPHRYNHHRQHAAIGGPPIGRVTNLAGHNNS
jgi:alpha-beta hydrolase superfamily lysophospholipase